MSGQPCLEVFVQYVKAIQFNKTAAGGLKKGLFLLALASLFLTGCQSQSVLYVSPNGHGSGRSKASPCSFGKSERILSAARQAKGDFVVSLRGGIYELDHPLMFDSEHSPNGTNRIIFRANPGETPIISGGIHITNWTPVEGTHFWQAHCPSNLKTRQLYFNGTRAIRATSKSGIPGTIQATATGYVTTDISLQTWKNPSEVEFVYTGGPAGSTLWTERRCGVASISGNGTNTVITMKQPCYSNMLQLGNNGVQKPTAIENARELLDEPGEWYLDTANATLYYMPRPGEDMLTATVIAPRLELLVHGKGTPAQPVRNIEFHGLTFSYATWLGPNGNEGFPELQANYVLGTNSSTCRTIPANVHFESAQNIRFERCVFEHLGGQGLAFDLGSQSNVIVGNVFTDVSGSAIRLGDVNETHPPRPAQERGNKISNNYIHDVCVEYHGGVGIFAGYVADTEISHNELDNLPYTGISVGWGWGAQSYMENNQITGNRIASVMQRLQDGGAIYTLSPQTNSVFTGNYIVNSKWNGIYHDEGTAYYTDRSNVVENAANWLSMWTQSIRNNDIQLTWYNGGGLQNNGVNNRIENNILVFGGNWPPEARAVMNSAGLEPLYQDIRTKKP